MIGWLDWILKNISCSNLLRILRPPHTGHPDHNSHPAGSREPSIQRVLKSRPKKSRYESGLNFLIKILRVAGQTVITRTFHSLYVSRGYNYASGYETTNRD
jgi:hypothetical protein